MINAGYSVDAARDASDAAFREYAGEKDHMLLENYVAYLARGMLLHIDPRTGQLACTPVKVPGPRLEKNGASRSLPPSRPAGLNESHGSMILSL